MAIDRSALWWRVTLAALLTAGCTQLMPIDVSHTDRRFPLKSDPPKPGSAYEAPCESGGSCPPLTENIDNYAGGLGRVLWELDVRRRELLGKVSDQTNLASAYDSLLWPVGALLIAKKIKDPAWSTIDAAAFATAVYGIMKSGIPGRDRLYLQAAVQLSCAMRVAEADLYETNDEDANARDSASSTGTCAAPVPESDRTNPASIAKGSTDARLPRGPDGPAGLRRRLRDLETAVEAYAANRHQALASLVLAPPASGKKSQYPDYQIRLEALGMASAPKARPDHTAEIAERSQAPWLEAVEALEEGRRLFRELRTAGARLRSERSVIEMNLIDALNGRTPAPRDPFAAGREMAQAIEQAVQASAKLPASAKGQSGRGSVAWIASQEELKAYEKGSSDRLEKLQRCEWPALRTRIDRVRRWTNDHARAAAEAREFAAAMGCEDASLKRLTADLAHRVVQTAAQVASAASAANKP